VPTPVDPAMPTTALLLTCEHGGNRVPAAWAERLAPLRSALATHRGWDPGSLDAARTMAKSTGAPLVAATVTRLLVDLNRSPHNPRVFSSVTRRLPKPERDSLLRDMHTPHWQLVMTEIRRLLDGADTVIHVGVHSFTPVLDGVARPFDVALLYDPGRRHEVEFCDRWLDELVWADPTLRLRRNAPYRGTDDGLVTALRRALPRRRYVGIELEINQSWPLGERRNWTHLRRTLGTTLARSSESLRPGTVLGASAPLRENA